MSPLISTLGAGSARGFGYGLGPSLPVVAGGTLYSDATYYYRKFTANGTLAVTGGNVTMDVLLVAGGGGGGGGIVWLCDIMSPSIFWYRKNILTIKVSINSK